MEIGPRAAALALFVGKLEAHSTISDEERAAVLALPGVPQKVGVHYDFVQPGDQLHHACLVTEGIVARFAQLEDGSRQITGFHIPGDMVDLYSLVLPRAASPLQAMTNSAILKIPHQALWDMAFDHRDLASAFWRSCVVDGHIVAQWLVNLGRRNARARTAHLLCEMAVRFAQIGRLRDDSYKFPVTQEQLADALGLTPVHVNRSLKALREDGLVRLTRNEVILLDWERLQAEAEFNTDYLHLPSASGLMKQAMAS